VLTVLASRVDTVEASFQGELKEGLAETLEALKRRAQREESPQPFLLGDTELMVQAKGLPPWPYVLTNEELHLRVGGGPKVPCVSVRLSAFGLALRGHEELWAHAKELAERLGATQAAISRLDLAVDFQGHAPTSEEMRNVTCPSGFRETIEKKGEVETFQFGKDEIVARIYNKSKEIVAKHKEWMRDVWAEHPAYQADEDVWRFEVQYRREALRRMQCISVERAFKVSPGLLYTGLYWVCPREVTESNLSRCEVQGWWEELIGQATFASTPIPKVKETKQIAGFAVLVPQMVGLLVSAAASVGVFDLATALDLQGDAFRSYIQRRGKPFEERVKERRRQLAH
jgi:hypothetical protein